MQADPLMDIYGVHTGQTAGPDRPISLEDPTVDWSQVAPMFQLTPEEIQELQVPTPQNGLGLRQRLGIPEGVWNLGTKAVENWFQGQMSAGGEGPRDIQTQRGY